MLDVETLGRIEWIRETILKQKYHNNIIASNNSSYGHTLKHILREATG